MEEQITNKDFKIWLEEQMEEEYLPYLLQNVREQLDGLTLQALKAGDTDFEKGQVKSLQWILELPESLTH